MSKFSENPITNFEDADDDAPISLSFLAPAFEPDELGRLAHYRILKLLGHGGMGIVLQAEDTQLQRPVALKVMRPELGRSLSNRQRFLREARAMAQVRSDHVVTVHQVGQIDDVCFLAMELLLGESLDQRLDRVGTMPLDESLRIGHEIALALAAAHTRGLIHRDVKPANVWLEAPSGRVKLLDFGLARPQDTDAHLTKSGTIVGTPMYMAPEQARGIAVDGRADLFSLGCVLYQMVTGRPAFQGTTALAVLTTVLTETPVPASQYNPLIPISLTNLFSRLLAKQPDDRPGSAEAVSTELQAIANSLSIPAAGSSTRVVPIDSVVRAVSPVAVPLSLLKTRESESTQTSQSQSRAREAERRQVTVLVCGCELFESEAYLGLESEDQAQVLLAFKQACEKTIKDFDGTVVQFNEQGLVSCFGFPIAYEDTAHRAARAGLRLLDDLRTLGKQLLQTQNLEAKPWVGLHTGPAIVELKGDAVSLIGEARNVAVRLKEAATPSQVICTETTHRLFKGRFQCTDIGQRTISGIARPITLFQVQKLAPSESLFDALTPGGLSPLVGRDHEINLLKDRWEQAQEGMGQIVFLVGEPGLGKSRLVHTLKDHVLKHLVEGDADAPVIEWRCAPQYQNTGFHPVIDFYERASGFHADDLPQDRFDRMLRRLAHYGLARPEVVPLWAALLSLPIPERFPPLLLSPARQREETFRLLLEWLHARAACRPVLFIIEDLHWIDASTLEFLGQFLSEFHHDRILTVLTFRPDFKPPWTAQEQQTTLALTRLTRRQVGDLMRKKAGNALPEAVIEQVFDRVGGVPLFVEEFTKMVQESETLKKGAEATATQALHKHEIPSTLQDLIMARLERTETGRELAQLASVLGREFSYELLAAVAALDEPTLQTELTQLIQAEILYSKGRPPRCNYIFKHALLEDALYNSLVKNKRQKFHRRIAETLESQFPQTTETCPELLAHHFTESGLTEKAIVYWLKAGQRSRERSALNEAIGHLTKGLALLKTLDEVPERDNRELQLLATLGPTYIEGRGYAAPEVGPVLLRASELCQRIGDQRQLFGVMLGMWEWRLVRGDLRLCPDLAADGLEIAEDLNDPGMLMEALFMPGVTMFYCGQFAGAREYHEKALENYDDRERTKYWTIHTGHDAGVTHRCYLTLVLWHHGYPDQAIKLNREMLELARTINHAFSLSHAIDFTAFLYYCCQLGAEVGIAAEEEMRIGTEQGFQLWRALGTLHKGASILLEGRPKEALPILLEGFAAFRATGAEIRAPSYLGMLADAYTQSAQFADAHKALNEALAVVEKNGDRCHEAELYRLKGELLLAESHDQFPLAEDSFRRAIETAKHQKSRAWELRATMSLARLLRQKGRSDEARSTLSTIYSTYTEGFATPDLMHANAMLQVLSG